MVNITINIRLGLYAWFLIRVLVWWVIPDVGVWDPDKNSVCDHSLPSIKLRLN